MIEFAVVDRGTGIPVESSGGLDKEAGPGTGNPDRIHRVGVAAVTSTQPIKSEIESYG